MAKKNSSRRRDLKPPEPAKSLSVLDADFFDRDSQLVAVELLGKFLCRRDPDNGLWYSARIIEAEAYYIWEKGSHASMGRTPSREPLFAPPGTIYMYYARGRDSFNVSCRGEGNAVLVKSAYPEAVFGNELQMIKAMKENNPIGKNRRRRKTEKLCSGQTLLCRAMKIRVPVFWNKSLPCPELFIGDTGEKPEKIIQAGRLGIPPHRDPHLLLRFIDAAFEKFCTSPVTSRRNLYEGRDYFIAEPGRQRLVTSDMVK